MYSKGHLKIKYFLGVTLGIIASFLFLPSTVNAATEECSFSDSFSRTVKNQCMYMEQWPVQKVENIKKLKTFSLVLTNSSITESLNDNDKLEIKKEFAENVPIGWTQGSTVTKDFFVLSLQSDKRGSYLAILDKTNYRLIKLLKEDVKNEWKHIHSIWSLPGTNIIRIDANHSINSEADGLDKCYNITPVTSASNLIVSAKRFSMNCSSIAPPANRSHGDDGLVYQGEAIYISDAKKKYNYTILWDAGEKSWLKGSYLNNFIKIRCTDNDKNCVYQHESEGMHYHRHNKVISIKDVSDGSIVKMLYISHKDLDGEPEGISFDTNGDMYLTTVKQKGKYPYATISKIEKSVHQPSYISDELRNWFSTGSATMVERGIKVSEEVEESQRAVICNTNNLSEKDHLFCVSNIYNRIKKAIQLGSANTIPEIRNSTTRKLFNEAVAKFKKAKYIKTILTNIKTTKITKKTIESFDHGTIIGVLSDMLAAGGTQTKCAVKYFYKVSDSFAKEMVSGFKEKGTFNILQKYPWSKSRSKLNKIAFNAVDNNTITDDRVLLTANVQAPTFILAAKKTGSSPEDETLEESDADDQDGSSSDDDINTNVDISTNDDESAPTIEKNSWQDDSLDADDGDEDYDGVYEGDKEDNDGSDMGKDDPDIPSTSCDPSVEGDCEVYDGGFGQTASNADICNAAGVPEAVRSAAGCTNLGEDSLGNKFAGIINIIISVIAIVAVVGIIYGGVQYMTAQGDPGKIKTAKNTIIYCAVGLGIVALSAAIVNWVISIT